MVGNVAHEILSIALSNGIHDIWSTNPSNEDETQERVWKEVQADFDEVYLESTDELKGRGFAVDQDLRPRVTDQVRGVLAGFVRGIMLQEKSPNRILTELTITNMKTRHEGRIDALFEWPHSGYGLIDWKTGNPDPIRSSGHDHWQIIANSLLANFRYAGNEDDFSRQRFAKGVYYQGVHSFRMPPSPANMAKVKDARTYTLTVLSGRSPPTRKPAFCPVCDGNCGPVEDCQYYRFEGKMAVEGKLPQGLSEIRREHFRLSYSITQERAVTHRHKFTLHRAIELWGEDEALAELERMGVVGTGYRIAGTKGKEVILKKDSGMGFQFRRTPVRIIGREKGIPLLACVSAQGNAKEAIAGELDVEFWHRSNLLRAVDQLAGLPLVVLKDEINLTGRMLEPLHYFHRWAGDALLPREDQINDPEP